MSRQRELETHIRDAYASIQKHKRQASQTDNPEKITRHLRAIEEQWGFIRGWAAEYSVSARRIPEDIRPVFVYLGYPQSSSTSIIGGVLLVILVIVAIVVALSQGPQSPLLERIQDEVITTPIELRTISDFQVGDRVKIVLRGNTRIRETAGYLNKPDDALCLAVTNDLFSIVGGPMFVDKAYWWQVAPVKSANCTVGGWIAEESQEYGTILGYAD